MEEHRQWRALERKYFFTSSGIINAGLSDHAMIYGIMHSKIKHYSSKILLCRNYAKLETLKCDLETAPWHVMDIFDSLEEEYECWHGVLNYVIEEHIPLKRKRVRSQDVPYMTKAWKDAIRNKKKAAKRFAKNRTEENWELKIKTRNEAT